MQKRTSFFTLVTKPRANIHSFNINQVAQDENEQKEFTVLQTLRQV